MSSSSSNNFISELSPLELQGGTAGDLFVFLFDRAKRQFELEDAALRDTQMLYMPYPLLQRMLNIVYRLRPHSCLSLPITFFDDQEQLSTSIPIPLGLREDSGRDAIWCIANYVPAFVLNRAVACGFTRCEIDLESLSLSRPGTDHPQGITGLGWKEKIEDAYRRNGYGVLLETYLGVYNTQGCMHLLPTSRSTTLQPIVISEIASDLRKYWLNKKSDDPSHPLLLGIDIGGTFTKVQFYELAPKQQKQFRTVGKPVRLLTPSTGGSPETATRAFASRLVQRVIDHLGSDTAFEGKNKKNIIAVGISWPGPVRNNRIAGTSRILERFPPLTRMIKENTFEKIVSLDIVGEFKSCWEGQAPTIVLLNDGTADGTGALLHLAGSTEAKVPSRLGVVKLGTGTAGAVFIDGRLDRGLMEWGKILLDLMAPPSPEFPNGISNAHLSAQTMPTLIKKKETQQLFNNVKNLDSLELGLILEAGIENINRPSFDELWNECGLRELPISESSRAEGLDVDVLRRVFVDGQSTADRESFQLIEHEFMDVGRGAEEEFRKRVEIFGAFRLEKLLYIDGQDLFEMRQKRSFLPASVKTQLQQAHKLVEQCTKVLGRYLGDFLVLLYDSYQIDTVILSGGVLSGKTGQAVRHHAVLRAQQYGLKLNPQGDSVFTLDNKDQMAFQKPEFYKSQEDPRPDFGTLGAAAFAAGEFLLGLKQRGLSELKDQLMQLEPTDEVILTDEAISTKAMSAMPIKLNLSQYGLSREDVTKFLEAYGPSLGFFRTAHGDITIYTRWEIRS